MGSAQRAKSGVTPASFFAPLKVRADYRTTRHPAVQAYLDACGPRGPDCSPAFEAASRTIEEWNDSETPLLERYSTLLTLGSWLEFISSHAAGLLPITYGPVSDGQELLLLHARIRARKGDVGGTRQLLEADLGFWRMVLASSDNLLTKMVATAALLRHFKHGADVVSELPPHYVLAATPDEWRVAITDRERSMWRCLAGEWIFSSGFLRRLDRELAADLLVDESIAGRMLAKLSGPLFQPQDTINLHAEYYTQVAGILEGVPLSGYESAANEATKLSRVNSERAFPPRTLFNIPGRIMLGFGPDFGAYARRLGDIEGVRLAALAAVSLHEAAMTPDDVPAALAASPYRNPYDGRPFTWDAGDEAVIFRGLEPGERGEHRIH